MRVWVGNQLTSHTSTLTHLLHLLWKQHRICLLGIKKWKQIFINAIRQQLKKNYKLWTLTGRSDQGQGEQNHTNQKYQLRCQEKNLGPKNNFPKFGFWAVNFFVC